jgi:hypothetical protein
VVRKLAIANFLNQNINCQKNRRHKGHVLNSIDFVYSTQRVEKIGNCQFSQLNKPTCEKIIKFPFFLVFCLSNKETTLGRDRKTVFEVNATAYLLYVPDREFFTDSKSF